MTYETPRLALVGAAGRVVLGPRDGTGDNTAGNGKTRPPAGIPLGLDD